MPVVKPEILVWARETAGLTPERAVIALGIKDKRNQTALQRLAALESGEKEPSRPMLLKMAQRYRRPLVAFYLSAPPKRGDRGEDFRTLPERQTASEALIDALLRDVRSRQSTVRDILVAEEQERLPFIGSAQMSAGPAAVLASIRQTIKLDIAEYRSQSSPELAFALLRSQVEAAGIFVLLIGNLGSHHTAIPVEAFRGFALSDEIAPFIVINDQDAPAAWSFTLLHELAHLWLGKTGVSGRTPDSQIEKFCNDVAAMFLLSTAELALVGVNHDTSPDAAAPLINSFATERHLSRSMVAYALYRASIIDEQTWQTLVAWFLAQWRKGREAKRERQKDSSSGPDYYVVRRHRLGSALLHLIARNMSEGTLTPTRASKVLGVKPRSVAPLLSPLSSMGGRAA